MRKKSPIAPHIALIGDRLREIRSDRFLTQVKLFDEIKRESVRLRLLGVFNLTSSSSYNVCYYMEAGLREPSFTEGILLSQILNTPPEALLPYWIRSKLTYPYAQRAAYPTESDALRDVALILAEPPSPDRKSVV